MDLIHDAPIMALLISLAFNLWQNNRKRSDTKGDKDAEDVLRLQRTMATVENTLVNLQNNTANLALEVKGIHDKTANIGALTERVENTKSSLSEIKSQLNKLTDLVQDLLVQHK